MTTPPVIGWSTPREALGLLVRGRSARTALPAAAVVGTLLTAVNQGAIVLSGDAAAATEVPVLAAAGALAGGILAAPTGSASSDDIGP